jgi:hypothetical protein
MAMLMLDIFAGIAFALALPLALPLLALAVMPMVNMGSIPIAIARTIIHSAFACGAIARTIIHSAFACVAIVNFGSIAIAITADQSHIARSDVAKCKTLILRTIGACRNVNPLRLARQALLVSILRHQAERPGLASKGKQLRIGDLSAAVGTSATREEIDLVPGLTSRVKVQARLRECAHDESLTLLVVVFAGGNDIPSLAVRRTTRGDLDRRQVFSEIARELVDKEAFAICGLDLDVGKGPCGSVVTLLGFSGSFLIEFGNCTPGWHCGN